MTPLAAYVLLFLAVGVGFILVHLLAGKMIRPNKPDAEKGTIYECGEPTIGTAWMNFNPRFYLIALVFVIFEVDIALTFPVVVVFKEWVAASPRLGLIALAELLLFTGILVVGLVWVWVHGDLEWLKKLAELDERPAQQRAGGRKAA